MNVVEYETLNYLYGLYIEYPSYFVPFNEIHANAYDAILAQGYDYYLTDNDLSITLEYFVSIGFVKSDNVNFRLTAQGKSYFECPPPDYPELNLQEQKRSTNLNRISILVTTLSLLVAIGSLYVAWLTLTATR